MNSKLKAPKLNLSLEEKEKLGKPTLPCLDDKTKKYLKGLKVCENTPKEVVQKVELIKNGKCFCFFLFNYHFCCFSSKCRFYVIFLQTPHLYHNPFENAGFKAVSYITFV